MTAKQRDWVGIIQIVGIIVAISGVFIAFGAYFEPWSRTDLVLSTLVEINASETPNGSTILSPAAQGVGINLQIVNKGNAPARNVYVSIHAYPNDSRISFFNTSGSLAFFPMAEKAYISHNYAFIYTPHVFPSGLHGRQIIFVPVNQGVKSAEIIVFITWDEGIRREAKSEYFKLQTVKLNSFSYHMD